LLLDGIHVDVPVSHSLAGSYINQNKLLPTLINTLLKNGKFCHVGCTLLLHIQVETNR